MTSRRFSGLSTWSLRSARTTQHTLSLEVEPGPPRQYRASIPDFKASGSHAVQL